MTFTAIQLALLTGGKVEGDANVTVDSFGKIEDALEGQLTFLANPKYEDFIYNTKASVIIVAENFQLKKPINTTLIRVKDPYAAFAILLEKYQELKVKKTTGIQQPSYIAESAKLGTDVFVAAFAYISENVSIGKNTAIHSGSFIGSNVKIGDNCEINPGVKIYHDCIIGNNVIIHAGTVIGSDGFGFAPQNEGYHKKVPQIGNVIIEDFVEIGANTTIDRATLGSTIIRSGAKLDNLIQVAHNVEIGGNTFIAAQTGISGSTKVGKNSMIGGQVGIAGHISLAEGSKVAAQSGVTKSIKNPNTVVNGTPAFNINNSLRIHALYRNLPEMEKRLKELEEMVKQLLSEKV
jgi:UDP-3-O-[3-hydroxymyristoyl] glucosamine N-acyltransferase